MAAGLRCTLANSGYNARELAYQYTDSGARLVFTSEEGIATVLEMFKELGLARSEIEKRIIVMSNDLQWAGGPKASSASEVAGLLRLEDFLQRGAMKEEEKFEGKQAHETVYLCYSSGK